MAGCGGEEVAGTARHADPTPNSCRIDLTLPSYVWCGGQSNMSDDLCKAMAAQIEYMAGDALDYSVGWFEAHTGGSTWEDLGPGGSTGDFEDLLGSWSSILTSTPSAQLIGGLVMAGGRDTDLNRCARTPDDIRTYQVAMDAEARALNSQHALIPLALTPPAGATAYDLTYEECGVQHLTETRARPVQSLPTHAAYFLERDDDKHLTAYAKRLSGAYSGKALYYQQVLGLNWAPLHVRSVTVAGDAIYLSYAGGYGFANTGLVLDCAGAGGDPGDSGFTLGNTTRTIDSVTKHSTWTLKLGLSGDVDPATTVRYALEGTPGNGAGPGTGIRGCVRNSGTVKFSETSTYASPTYLHDWAIPEPLTTTGTYSRVDAWHVSLDGVNDYIKTADSDDVECGPELTVSAWVRFDDGTKKGMIAAKRTAGSQLEFAFWYRGDLSPQRLLGGVKASAGAAFTDWVAVDWSATNGTWYKLSMVFEPGAIRLYADDVEQTTNKSTTGTIPAVITHGTAPFEFGSHNDGGSMPLGGDISQAIVWCEALEPAELAADAGDTTPRIDLRDGTSGTTWTNWAPGADFELNNGAAFVSGGPP